MSVCIPTYMLASGLIAGGMNWWQAIGTILLGNLIVLVPMLLNAHAGAKYGIPFPVFVRASFGVRAQTSPPCCALSSPAAGSASRPGSAAQAINSMLQFFAPGWRTSRPANGSASSLSGLSTWRSSFAASKPSKSSKASPRPSCWRVGLLLLWWITGKAGGLGPVLAAPSRFQTNAEFMKFFIPSLTGMVGFWATVALNIPDFTRYAKSQRAQTVGQALGLPAAMTLYSFIGVAVTSASAVLFGEPIWDPVALLGKFHQPVVASIALVALLVATLNTNVAANVVSPSNDFSNLNPRLISFRTGGMITGVVGVLMMPWKLLGDFSAYIFGWLVGYSGLLGPIAGVMIADYFIVRKASLNVDDLYRRAVPTNIPRASTQRASAHSARACSSLSSACSFQHSRSFIAMLGSSASSFPLLYISL